MFPPTERGLFYLAASQPSFGNRELARMEKSPQPTARSHQRTVLVVDADPRILKLVSEVMRDGNHKVLTASSGSLALEESRNYKGEIDLLII